MSTIIQWIQTHSIAGLQYCFWLSAATMLFSVYLEKRDHPVWRMAASMGLFGLFCWVFPPNIGSAYPIEGFLWYVAMYLVNIAVVYSYCRVSIWEAVSCAMFGTLTEHLGSAAYILIFVSTYSFELTYVLISVVVDLSIWFFIGRKMAHHGHYHVKPWSTVMISGIVMLVTIALSYLCKATADPWSTMTFETETVRQMLQLSQWYAIAFCIAMLVIQWQHQEQIQMQLDLSKSHELLRVHEQHYHLTRENIDLINRKCHDMKHQVSLLMHEQVGDEKRRNQFAREVSKMIEVYDTNIDTGNEVLNTVLRDKSLYCSMKDITWTCAAHGELLTFMDLMDLVSLMGNALDNAVEAVEHIPDKNQQIINVQIAPRNNMMQFLIENTFDGTLKRSGNAFLTRKQDRSYHGIGLKSISAIAEKYGGCATTSTDGNTFVLNILIPIPGDENGKEIHYGKHNEGSQEKDEQ